MLTLREKSSPGGISKFNSETSGGVCGAAQEGVIARTKVATGAQVRAKSLGLNAPEDLATLLITISWCGKRLERWPTAKDAKTTLALRDEFVEAADKYPPHELLSHIDEIAQAIGDFDERLIAEELAALRAAPKVLPFSSSPLFIEFNKKYPRIDPKTFDTVYNQHGGKFVPAAIYLLRRDFKANRPEIFSAVENWSQCWQQHLPQYLQSWQNDLKKMELRMRLAQKQWKQKSEE